MKTIKITKDKQTTTIWLAKPRVRNAFDETMVEELIAVYNELTDDLGVKVIVLRGEGGMFSAGADLRWMKQLATNSYEENVKGARRLAECFYTIYTSRKPTIALVHGASFGGANGLLASCDVVIADKKTVFSFSEVKLGIIPAVISPYIIKRIGEFSAREMMLTGQPFDGEKAKTIGLVNVSCSFEEIETELAKYVALFLASGTNAIAECKNLIEQVTGKEITRELIEYTAQRIATVRNSEEGKEGMSAFLEKRKPNWR